MMYLLINTDIYRCAFQPTGGKIYQQFNLKWSFLFFLGIFELGSLLCGAANSSVMLIIGRAVAGMGASGIFSGALVIISTSIAPQLRPGEVILTTLFEY